MIFLIQVKKEVIKQMIVNAGIKTLGVYLNPIIDWKDQHDHVKNKMLLAIKKLMRTCMTSYGAHMCFNM